MGQQPSDWTHVHPYQETIVNAARQILDAVAVTRNGARCNSQLLR